MDSTESFLGHSRNILDLEMPLDDIQASVEHQFKFQRCHGSPNTRAGVDGLEVPLPYLKLESPEADEEEAEQCIRSGVATVIDLTEDDTSVATEVNETNTRVSRTPPSTVSIDEQHQLDEFEYGNGKLLLRSGVVVEINEIKDIYRATFLKIQYIIQTPEGVILRGLPFVRTRNLRGRLPRLRNEVCLVLRVDEDDPQDDEVQAAVDVPVTDVIRTRNVHCTNAKFPGNRFDNVYTTIEEIETYGMLACRWKYRLLYKTRAARGGRQTPCQYVLAHLRADEASTVHTRVSDTVRWNDWRGSKVRGGSYNKNTRQDLEAIESLDEHFDTEHTWIDKTLGQRYTVGDMFCGAGGTSLGAQQAGFHIRVACDIAPHACVTHRNNFPLADLRQEDIWKFIREDLVWGGKSDYVDVLHLSPPCQFWSPAHTVPGQNDEANIAVLFSCHELIKKLKPRIFTLEQTFGILHPRFEHYFNALIQGFTQYDYSIRWKVINFVEWGLPSRRNRLIMIGACPGEKLPTFPSNTHAKNPSPEDGLRPFATVMDAMRRIPPDATMHEKKHVRFKRPWDPNIPLARCITTHGGYGNYHYSGKRDFTLRELATMNGFPTTYQFHPQNAKKQIGNAFPPCVVRVLYSHLLKWLENEDRVRPVEDQAMYEEEPDHDVVQSEVEDDIEITGVRVKRQQSDVFGGDWEMMEIDQTMFCVDPGQSNDRQRGSVVDLTVDSPSVPGNNSPIFVRDDEDDVFTQIM